MQNPFPNPSTVMYKDAELRQDAFSDRSAEDLLVAELDSSANATENCSFVKGMDFLGTDEGPVEGLTKNTCCGLCIRRNTEEPGACWVAVMSAYQDSPPRACWIKRKVTSSIQKSGVLACLPPGSDSWLSKL